MFKNQVSIDMERRHVRCHRLCGNSDRGRHDDGTGNVAGWVKNATLKGPASATTSVTIAVHMALKNLAALKSFVAEVSNPKGREYGQYLSPRSSPRATRPRRPM